MAHQPSDDAHMAAPLDRLEQALIDEYLRSSGHDPARLSELPESEREALLKRASIHASTKLSEVEARSRLLHDLHVGGPGATRTGLE